MAKILLVDDEPAILKIFQIMLTREGHDVRITENGEEAIGMVQRGDIDLIISDVRMDPVDGFEVLSRVRRHDQTYRSSCCPRTMATLVSQRRPDWALSVS